jgi:hypothetical protein
LLDPIERMAIINVDLETVGETIEDDVRTYFQESSLRNVGYWHGESITPRKAAADMLAELLSAPLERLKEDESFSALILGPNSGPVASELLRIRKQAQVTVVVHDRAAAKQIQGAEPRAALTLARRGRLVLGDRKFDLVLGIEEPSLFDDNRLLREMCRVLKPGGALAASHILAYEHGDSTPVADVIARYEQELAKAGLADVRVADASDKTWRPFFLHSRGYFRSKLLFNLFYKDRLQAIFDALPGGNQHVGAYLTINGSRPQDG